jgi:hypothetical protein
MDSMTIHRTLSSKHTLFKLGLTDDPICEMCLEQDESATHILRDSVIWASSSWNQVTFMTSP